MRKALYILGDLEDRDIIWLSRNGIVRPIAPGSVLIAAGRPVVDLFFVTDGAFAVTGPRGEALAELGLGDVIGEMSFVEKRVPTATVTARDEARVLAVSRDALLAAFAQDSGFAARFYRALAVFLSDRLRAASTQGNDADEIDEGLLDTIHQAGERFVRLVALLEGRER